LFGPIAGKLVYQVSSDASQSEEVLGHQMHLATEGRYPPLDMMSGKYEQQTTQVFEEAAKPGMVVLDIGAHVGYYSLLAARIVGPEGRVYSFEPEPQNYSLLVKNIDRNGYENITPVNAAVSNQMGVATLNLSTLDNGRHSLFVSNPSQSSTETVNTTTIDAFLENSASPNVGLIKIDVEGAELAVLDGMGKLLEKHDQLSLIIEFNPGLLQTAGVDLVQFLKRPSQWGLKVQIIDERRGLTPLDDADSDSLINRLLTSESSVNLLCQRP